MELAGLEPATSWVRSSSSAAPGISDLQAFYNCRATALAAFIAVDIGRFLSFQALLAMSA
jgi:hypothetical protein